MFEFLAQLPPLFISMIVGGSIAGLSYFLFRSQFVAIVTAITCIVLFRAVGAPYLDFLAFKEAFYNAVGETPRLLEGSRNITLDNINFEGRHIVRTFHVPMIIEDKELLSKTLRDGLIQEGVCDWLVEMNNRGFVESDTYNYWFEQGRITILITPNDCKR